MDAGLVLWSQGTWLSLRGSSLGRKEVEAALAEIQINWTLHG